MFAVIKTGGKQYKVAKDDVIVVEKLNAEVGSTVTFDNVLALDEKIGTPTIAGAKVSAKVVKQTRDDTVIVFKKKRRQGYRRKNGHRQYISIVKITDIAE
ncbi:MAG: 50S ribosomal protein L21 [Alphaproteobacteria bacterium]|nr:50S ribosomal protein L21 [Alphaproteobacteria bacterium]MBO4644339.1 50S ribosomal protein L21 [Alphaproteobacteria bacterium]